MKPELEIILTEGAGIQPGYSSQKLLDKCKRCKLSQISIAGIDLFTKKVIMKRKMLLIVMFFIFGRIIVITFIQDKKYESNLISFYYS